MYEVLVQDDQLKRGQWKIGIIESLIVGKDGQVRGVNLRVSGKGKPQFCSKPVQKVYPLEYLFRGRETDREDMEKDVDPGMIRDSTEGNEDGKKVGMEIENERESRYHPKRAAAKDAQWKTKLMLDHA